MRYILLVLYFALVSTSCSTRSEVKYDSSTDTWTINGKKSTGPDIEKYLSEDSIPETKLVYVREDGTVSTYTFEEFVLAINGASTTETRLSHSNYQNDPGNPFIPQKAEQMRISQLKETLGKLRDGKLEYDFFGITSNGVDCLYFSYGDSGFNLEFEAMTKEQKPFFEGLTGYSVANGITAIKTTYGNRTLYDSQIESPVLRLEINASLEDTEILGRKILNEIFGNDRDTVYEIVP